MINEYREFGINNTWWINQENEKYWFEIRDIYAKELSFNQDGQIVGEIGKDIWAPHYLPESNKRYWSYSLVNLVQEGDIIFHYAKQTRSIVGYSTASSLSFNDKERWNSSEPVDVFKVKLKDYIPLKNPITYNELKEKSEKLRNFLINNNHIKYAPFTKKGNNLVLESYLTKFPLGAIEILNLKEDSQDYRNIYSIKHKRKINKLINAKKKRAKLRNKELKIKNNPYDRTIPQQGQNTPNATKKEEREYLEIELELRFTEFLKYKNITPNIKKIGDFENDIFLPEKNTLIEAKSSTNTPNIRMVIGQIKHYNYLLSKEGQAPEFSAALFPEKPSKDMINLMSSEKIYCIWEEGLNNFKNNFEFDLFN